MTTLFETAVLKLAHKYETTYLVEKASGRLLMEDELHGDPTCGLIDADNQWAIAAGHHVTIWTPKKTERWEGEPQWIHAIRAKEEDRVELLTDPWGAAPAIWELHVQRLAFNKVRDFLYLQGQEYREIVDW